MVKKLMGFLVIILILSGCVENSDDEKETTIEEVYAGPIAEGTITIGKNENELILNEKDTEEYSC